MCVCYHTVYRISCVIYRTILTSLVVHCLLYREPANFRVPKFAGPEFAGPGFAGPGIAGPEFAGWQRV